MKTFLFAVLALSAIQVTAWAADEDSGQEQLFPADELAQQFGLDQAVDADSLVPPPPHQPPHYPPPHNPPPHYPPPHNPPPHYPPPHYPPPHNPPPHYPPAPRPVRFECSSRDDFGRVYFANGRNPRRVQQDVHNHCEYMSRGPCRDLGCRSY